MPVERQPRPRLSVARDAAGTWGNLNRNRLRAVFDHARGDVLDIGCGSDAYTAALRSRGHATVGIDYLALQDPPPAFARASATRLPFREDAFGTALLFEVLEHIEDPELALREIGRVAGRLVMSVPNCERDAVLAMAGLVQYHYTDPTHVNFFDEASIRSLLEASGWSVTEVRHINPVSPGALSLHGWGVPVGVIRRIAPILKRLPRPRPLTMSIVVIADRV